MSLYYRTFSCAHAVSASLNCASTLDSGVWAGMLRMWSTLRTAALRPFGPGSSPDGRAPLAADLGFFILLAAHGNCHGRFTPT